MIAPKFIAITDTAIVSTEVLFARSRMLCSKSHAGTVMLQLRDKHLPIRERLQLGERLCEIARESSQYFCVNDRLDLALSLGAHALHLGESSVSVRDIRQYLGQRLWLSRAVHENTPWEASGADAIILSPICEARKGTQARGLRALARATALTSIPVYALGGVNAGNAASCMTAGASGVAAIGAWLTAESLEPLLAALGISRGCG